MGKELTSKTYKGRPIAGKVSDLHKGIAKMLGSDKECQCENCKMARILKVID